MIFRVCATIVLVALGLLLCTGALAAKEPRTDLPWHITSGLLVLMAWGALIVALVAVVWSCGAGPW